MMKQSNVLLLSLVITVAAARNITVCVIEQDDYNTKSLNKELKHWAEVDLMLRSRLNGLNVSVTLDRHVVHATQFPWFSLSACSELNPSCSGVVTMAPCQHAQFMDSWAAEHVIPSVIITDRACSLTSSHSVTVVTRNRLEAPLLQQLLTRLGWSQVAMLVDSSSIAFTSASDLVKRLSDVYLGSLVFRLFDAAANETINTTQADRMRQNLRTVKESHFFNILVIASHYSAEVVLKEARTAGLLSRQYFWLVVVPDDQCSNVLRLVTGNETNVLLVQPVPTGLDPAKLCTYPTKTCENASSYNQFDALPIAVSIEAITRTSQDEETQETLHDTAGDICSNRQTDPGRQAAILDYVSRVAVPHLIDDRLIYDASGHLSGAIYSVCSTDSNQRTGVSYVGQWTLEGGLDLQEENGKLYRNTFRDFGYRTLRIGTQEAKPFVEKKTKDGKVTFEGFCVDILEELAKKLKFKYEFMEPADKQWGAPAAKNATYWTGIVGMVMRKEVDIGVGPITITSIREEVIDFTKPFMEDGIGILTKRPNSDSKNMFKMFTPLMPQVWGAVAGAVVLVSVCLYAIERLSPFSASNLTGDRTLGLLECTWLIYGSYMEQGGDPHPRSVSARCMVGFWWLFTILMTSTYTANLAAFLTVTIQDTPINSLSELAQSSDLKPLVKTGSNIHTLFMESEGGVYRDVWNKMGSMPKVTSNDAAFSHVLTGSYAYMTDASQLEYIMLKDCTTYSLAKEIFNTGGFGFVLPEDAPYMDVINYNIMKMHEAGLVDKWRQRWWSSPDPCTTTDRTSEYKKLDWPSLSGLFYIFLGVASSSIIFRVLEFWLQGEKISQFWFRLKSMVRLAASSDNTSSSNTISEDPTTSSTTGKAAKHCGVHSRPPLRSGAESPTPGVDGPRSVTDGLRYGMDGSEGYTNAALEVRETGVFFAGREREMTMNGLPNASCTLSSSADPGRDRAHKRSASGHSHRKARSAARKSSHDSNP